MSHFFHVPSPKIRGNIEPYPGNHSGSPALRHRLLFSIARIRDNLLLELEVLCPKVGEELDADIAFTDGDEGQQGGNVVSRQMVRLEAKVFLEHREKSLTGRPRLRSKCTTKTTYWWCGVDVGVLYI
jgi:hypothetical protein